MAKLLVDRVGDSGVGFVQPIEPPADLLQSPNFLAVEEFAFVDGVRVKE